MGAAPEVAHVSGRFIAYCCYHRPARGARPIGRGPVIAHGTGRLSQRLRAPRQSLGPALPDLDRRSRTGLRRAARCGDGSANRLRRTSRQAQAGSHPPCASGYRATRKKRERFEELLVLAHFAMPLREDHHFWIDFSGTCRARRFVLAAGRRLGRRHSAADQALSTSVQARAGRRQPSLEFPGPSRLQLQRPL